MHSLFYILQTCKMHFHFVIHAVTVYFVVNKCKQRNVHSSNGIADFDENSKKINLKKKKAKILKH